MCVWNLLSCKLQLSSKCKKSNISRMLSDVLALIWNLLKLYLYRYDVASKRSLDERPYDSSHSSCVANGHHRGTMDTVQIHSLGIRTGWAHHIIGVHPLCYKNWWSEKQPSQVTNLLLRGHSNKYSNNFELGYLFHILISTLCIMNHNWASFSVKWLELLSLIFNMMTIHIPTHT